MNFWFILISFCGSSTSLLFAFLIVVGTRSLSMPDYLVGLENSGWLRHIKALMDAAIFLAKVKLFVCGILLLVFQYSVGLPLTKDFSNRLVIVNLFH